LLDLLILSNQTVYTACMFSLANISHAPVSFLQEYHVYGNFIKS